MIEQLFGSKTRVKLLQLFYSNPNRSFYVREITRKVDEQINSVRRELANLLSIGIITSDSSNNKVYYEVDQKFEYFSPLQELFGGVKPKSRKSTKTSISEGKKTPKSPSFNNQLLEELQMVGNIEVACLLGQFTRDETAGIDVLVIGNVNQHALQKFVTELEAKENKELKYTVFSLEDFQYRQHINDRFVSNILMAKKQVLIDKPGIFLDTE